LEFLTTARKQEEELKQIQIGKEEVKSVLFADSMILCLNTLIIAYTLSTTKLEIRAK
jgi:hypothetical protein